MLLPLLKPRVARLGDLNAAADPTGRRAVVGRFDFHPPVQMHNALAVLVVAEGLQWGTAAVPDALLRTSLQPGVSSCVDARVGPAFFPAVEIRLRFLDALETEALQRCSFRITAGFHFALPVRPARGRA